MIIDVEFPYPVKLLDENNKEIELFIFYEVKENKIYCRYNNNKYFIHCRTIDKYFNKLKNKNAHELHLKVIKIFYKRILNDSDKSK